ncbi:Synaptotagmin-4 [Capsicum annuum]|nr:Synaptotagmin-4 [Capsicum annuum]KAF3673165.1 Synaptotagmin-4 [Capsicum annuum]
MGFFMGFFLGAALGVGLIVFFARFQNNRSKARIDLAKAITSFARMTVQDSRKLLPPEAYPSWLNWLNQHFEKIWPYVDEAASELIRTSVEPVLEQYRPSILAALKFSKLTLGTVAPSFTGVSILDGDHGEIIMELEMQWDGNPNIVLDIKTLVGVGLPIQVQIPSETKILGDFFPSVLVLVDRVTWYLLLEEGGKYPMKLVEVKNIGFTGVFRLIFKPLVAELPCFGAVCYSLRHKKNLDFTLKVVGGDISAIPGVSDAIEGTIRDAIEDSITWPVRKIVPILPGDYSDLELKPVGILQVKLIEAKELTNKDLIGKSDPFVELFIRPLRDRTKTSKVIVRELRSLIVLLSFLIYLSTNEKCLTPDFVCFVKDNCLNPIWNEHFEFIVEDISTQHLTIRVYDDEGIQAAEFIGCARIDLKDLEPGKVKDVWLKLVKDLEIQRDTKNRGQSQILDPALQVHLELLFCPFGMDSVFMKGFKPDYALTTLEKALRPEAANFSQANSEKKGDILFRGVLSVTVISAEDVPVTDLMGKSDPFVVLIMKKSEQKNKTRVLNNTLNPVWNQTFDFVVEDGLHDLLILEVWDHDTFGKDKIGRCIMTLTRVILEEEFKDTFTLDGAKSGRLTIHLKWTPQPIIRD